MLPAAAPRSRAAAAHPKRRGSYNCGRCGLPKKGHVCSSDPSDPSPSPSPASAPLPPRSDLRRALSFEDAPSAAGQSPAAAPEDKEVVGGLPAGCLAEVLRRLAPRELMKAAAVSRGWRECVRRVWSSAEEVRLRVDPQSQIGFLGSMLHRCAGLARLVLRMESHVDATVLACVAFSCPNLELFEMTMDSNAVNRITGVELGRFVAEKRCLSVLKIEGCANLCSLNLYSSSLSTLWLSDIYCISKMVINCLNLKELSLDFTRQENDSTDLTNIMDSLGRTCPSLRNVHIASARLCNDTVLALAGANLRDLRMLSLVLGSKITDASVAAIVSSYGSLELLDLSGSSISDSGIGMICNGFPRTLSKLLLALCPNITSNGIQHATNQLPHLQLLDCGMSLINHRSSNGNIEDYSFESSVSSAECMHPRLPGTKPHPLRQKLIIEHECLRKLSLWGCSGLDALYLSCPELNDLNLTSCTNLNPERLLLQCPNLENVHVSGCQDMLIGAVRNQVLNEFAAAEDHFPCKRLGDGSKRVQVPHGVVQQPSDDEKRKRGWRSQCAVHL